MVCIWQEYDREEAHISCLVGEYLSEPSNWVNETIATHLNLKIIESLNFYVLLLVLICFVLSYFLGFQDTWKLSSTSQDWWTCLSLQRPSWGPFSCSWQGKHHQLWRIEHVSHFLFNFCFTSLYTHLKWQKKNAKNLWLSCITRRRVARCQRLLGHPLWPSRRAGPDGLLAQNPSWFLKIRIFFFRSAKFVGSGWWASHVWCVFFFLHQLFDVLTFGLALFCSMLLGFLREAPEPSSTAPSNFGSKRVFFWIFSAGTILTCWFCCKVGETLGSEGSFGTKPWKSLEWFHVNEQLPSHFQQSMVYCLLPFEILQRPKNLREKESGASWAGQAGGATDLRDQKRLAKWTGWSGAQKWLL